MTGTTIRFGGIAATPENGKAIRELTRQDLILGGLPNAEIEADPLNAAQVKDQVDRLKNQANKYRGAYVDGQLVGYLKVAEWLRADERDFRIARGMRADRFGNRTVINGIFGLVASNWLTKDEQVHVVDRFVQHALSTIALTGITNPRSAVNIVLYDNDPVHEVTNAYGFERIGVGGARGIAGVESVGKIEQGLFQHAFRLSDNDARIIHR